jgi:two-component system, LytTR family, sensor kinase
MARLNWTRIGYHASFWLVYLPLNAVLYCVINRLPLFDNFYRALSGEIIVLPVKMMLVYYVFYYIIPLYLDRDKVFRLLLMSLIGVTTTMLIYRLVVKYVWAPIYAPNASINIFDGETLYLTLFDIFITLVAATTIKMIRVHYASLEFEQELIREKLQSELNFLRAQTNPHFLFNTLNNLYVLARKKSDTTPQAIMMLSKIMRFMLYECRSARIPLSSEVLVLKDYIELEKLRYNNRLTVHFEEKMDNPGALIAPLLLLPFVENSFKHGANSTTEKAEIKISLILEADKLNFQVDNTFEEKPQHRDDFLPGGIGLKNEQRQLELIYPDRHSLSVKREEGWWKAHLYIDLKE